MAKGGDFFHKFLMIICLVGPLSVVGCRGESKEETVQKLYASVRSQFSDVPEIQLSQLRRSDVVFVDVRSEDERSISTIPNAISISDFEENPPKKNKKVVVYCTIGHRSAQVVRKLRRQGFSAFNLEKGLLGWLYQRGKLIDSTGAVTTRVHVYGKRWDLAPERFSTVW